MTGPQVSWAVRCAPAHLRDDALQEARLAVWLAESRYDPRLSSFRSFSVRRAEGAVIDFLRAEDPLSRGERRKVKAGMAFGIRIVDLSEAWRKPAPDISPERAAINRQALRLLAFAHRRERRVLELYFLAGLRLREIARILGVNESRVCQLKFAGLRHIREQAGIS